MNHRYKWDTSDSPTRRPAKLAGSFVDSWYHKIRGALNQP